MDLAGIGAVAAATVAAVGVPAALVVGRWQVRGALTQAEKTYQAALDAAHATAASTHAQWRRSTRREAYVELLLSTAAIERWDPPLDLPPGEAREECSAELRKAERRTETAVHIVQLESEELGDLAFRLMSAATRYGDRKYVQAVSRWALNQVRRHEAMEQIGFPEVWEALEGLRQLTILDPRTDTPERSQATKEAESVLVSALTSTGVLDRDQVRDIVYQEVRWRGPAALGKTLRSARRVFVQAARAELDGHAAPPPAGPTAL